MYTEDLRKIDPQDHGIAPPTPDPLIWEPFLFSHPDQWFANYIRRGITRGFKIGFDNRRCSLRSAVHNHPSAHAHNTQRSYSSAKRQYLKFCLAANLIPLPVTEYNLCLFVAYLSHHSKLQPSSIKAYLAAVRHLQVSFGLPDPLITTSFPRLTYVIWIHRLTQATNYARQVAVIIPGMVFSAHYV